MFRPETPQIGVELTSTVLKYEPTNRLTPLQCCIHPFFDEIREEGKRLPNGRELPPYLFELSDVGKCFIDSNVLNNSLSVLSHNDVVLFFFSTCFFCLIVLLFNRKIKSYDRHHKIHSKTHAK